MICGIDVYHSGVGQSMKGSVAGFVASLDKLLTSWHSKICLQGKHQELVDILQICLISAIKAYYRVSNIHLYVYICIFIIFIYFYYIYKYILLIILYYIYIVILLYCSEINVIQIVSLCTEMELVMDN